jgi:flagellar basal-body rod protein FlgG
MLDAFYISASSLHAHQVHVDVIANNLANVNTTGFKKSKVQFEDLMYLELASAKGLLRNPDIDNGRGMGTATASIEKVFSQGEIKSTGRNLDIAIEGNGFLELLLPDGEYAYSRTGHLQIDREGLLVNSDGYALSPSIYIPADAQEVVISSDGEISVTLPGKADPVALGRIDLAGFINPGGLSPLGDNLYRPSQASGDAFYGAPGDEGFGALAQGFLEGSNVSLIEELTNMMLAQRGYEINAKVIQAADEMLGIVNNLRR